LPALHGTISKLRPVQARSNILHCKKQSAVSIIPSTRGGVARVGVFFPRMRGTDQKLDGLGAMRFVRQLLKPPF